MTKSEMVETLVKENDALKAQNAALNQTIAELREAGAALDTELDAAKDRIAALEASGAVVQNHGYYRT